MIKPLVTVVAAVLIQSDKRILLAQRPAHKNMGGLWEFPGGKIEQGESPERALQRELEEELGILVALTDFKAETFVSHEYDSFHLLMLIYTAYYWQGQLLKKEHQALEWVAADALENYPMPPADLPLIPLIRQWVERD